MERGRLHPAGVERGRMHPADVDRVVEELAGRQHDRFARWQLVRLGIRDDAIRWRLQTKRWRRVRLGVYTLGAGRPSRRALWMEDVLACGPGAGLGGRSVLELLDIRRATDRRTVVITSQRGRRKPKGIDLRTSSDAEFITWDGIPITPLPRALADAARDLDDEQLEAAYEKAITRWQLPPSLIPKRNRRLNRLIHDHEMGSAMTDSDLENLFRTILKQAGLPQPKSNAGVWTGERLFRPDFLWEEQKLIAEIDGGVHAHQQHADRLREAELAAIGHHIQRFDRLQLIRHADRVVAALRPFL